MSLGYGVRVGAELFSFPWPIDGTRMMYNPVRGLRSSGGKGKRLLDLTREWDSHLDQRLRTEPLSWLTAPRPDGRSYLVPLWCWWDGAMVLVFSLPTTQNIRNMQYNPVVMVALSRQTKATRSWSR